MGNVSYHGMRVERGAAEPRRSFAARNAGTLSMLRSAHTPIRNWLPVAQQLPIFLRRSAENEHGKTASRQHNSKLAKNQHRDVSRKRSKHTAILDISAIRCLHRRHQPLFI
jgi:hypothetical protein